MKMSKLQIDSDGFQVVRPKNSVKSKILIPTKDLKKQDIKIDIEKSQRRIQTAIKEVEESQYFKDVKREVSHISADKKVVEILCFGLGHVGECNISRYQLALLLCLKSQLKLDKVLVHDPIFYTDECTLLSKFDLSVIIENTEGNYATTKNGITLVYLPHCPKQLTNNFLWSNWGLNLYNCILLCNSFSSLIESHPNRVLKEIVPCLNKIHPLCTEVALENSFLYKDIFNDISLHFFPKSKLESVSTDFWILEKKPDYKNSVKMATITTKPALVTLRQLLSEIRHQSSNKKLTENQMVRYILDQYRKHQITDQQLCKAADEMHFRAKTYYNYLHYSRKYKEINSEFKGMGERTVQDTARMVGFKLPHEPK